MSIRTAIKLSGKTATGITVPEDVVAGLGAGNRPAVRVTINGYMYRSTIARMGGAFMLPVSADVRARAGVAAGDVVDVDIELDSEPREVAVPADFAEALAGNPAAAQRFGGLSYSQRLRWVLSIDGAKTAGTRQRRIAAAIEALREGRAQ